MGSTTAAIDAGGPPSHLSISVHESGAVVAAVDGNGHGRGHGNGHSGGSGGRSSSPHNGPTDQQQHPHARSSSSKAAAPPPGTKAHQQQPRQQHHHRQQRRSSCRLPTRDGLRRARRPVLLALGVTALLVVGSFLVARYKKDLLSAAEWIRGQAPWSAVYYSLIIFVWILLCLPSSLVEMVAGMIYSYPTALATVVVGKQLACNLAFLLGRRFLSTSVLMRGEGLLLARLEEEEKEEEEAAEAEAAAVAAVAAEGTASNSSASDSGDGSDRSEGALSRGLTPVEGALEGGEGEGVEMGSIGEGVEARQEQPLRPHQRYSNTTMQVGGCGAGLWVCACGRGSSEERARSCTHEPIIKLPTDNSRHQRIPHPLPRPGNI